MARPIVLCVAGEMSGDVLLAPAIRSLVSRGFECLGVGGTRCDEAGLHPLFDGSVLNGGGLLEVIPRIPAFLGLKRKLISVLPKSVGVIVADTPEMGLRLMSAAKAMNKRTMYLSPPQTWAWRARRTEHLKGVDWVGCLFRFERDWYQKQEVAARWIGHPFGAIAGQERANGTGLAVVPGSRIGPIKRLLPIFAEAGRRALATGLASAIHVSTVPGVHISVYQRLMAPTGLVPHFHSTLESALVSSSAALVGAGTASLEAVCRGVPVVIGARVNPITAALASRLIRAEHFGLPNLILGRRLFPELVQRSCKPDHIYEALKGFKANGDVLNAGISDVLEELGQRNYLDEIEHGIDYVFRV